MWCKPITPLPVKLPASALLTSVNTHSFSSGCLHEKAKSRSQGLSSSCQLCQICSWSLDYVEWDVCNSHYWTFRLKIKTQCAFLCGCRFPSLPSAPPELAGEGSKAEGREWAARGRYILAALRASGTLKWASTVMGRPGKKEEEFTLPTSVWSWGSVNSQILQRIDPHQHQTRPTPCTWVGFKPLHPLPGLSSCLS